MPLTADFGAEIPCVTILALVACQKFAPLAGPPSHHDHKGATSLGLLAMLPSAPQHPCPTLGLSNGGVSLGLSSPCAVPASTPLFPKLDAPGSVGWGKNIHLGSGDTASVQGCLWPCWGAR